MATVAPKKNRRTASREARRRQLIDATMKCIARKGLGNTSIGDVASEAGLSQGIVNLHFESKDNLLTETLRTLANECRVRHPQAAIVSIHPGTTLEDVLSNMNFEPIVPGDVPTTEPPTAEQVRVIREEIDPERKYAG